MNSYMHDPQVVAIVMSAMSFDPAKISAEDEAKHFATMLFNLWALGIATVTMVHYLFSLHMISW